MPSPQELYPLHMLWINSCIEEKHRLSDWERKFIFDIKIQLTRKGSLSDKQAEKLESIYANKTS